MLITKKNFHEVVPKLKNCEVFAFDTETFGLNYWESSWLGTRPGFFSLQISLGSGEDFYFDFHHSPDRCDGDELALLQENLFDDPSKTCAGFNLKFDINQARAMGLRVHNKTWCVRELQRVVNNLEPKRSLDALAEKYLGKKKVEIEAPTSRIKTPLGKEFDRKHYEQLPLATLVEYGCMDTRLTFELYQWQLAQLVLIDQKVHHATGGKKSIWNVVENECRLTPVLAEMDYLGVKIDRAYVEKAYHAEKEIYERLGTELDALAYPDKIDWLSPKQLKPLFERLGLTYSYTEKGNASFDAEALEANDDELSRKILEYRFYYKRVHTYFESYLTLADVNDVLHPSSQQGGTAQARMSYWEPNLQNVPKRTDKDSGAYKVRKCFVPRDGYFFADIDYNAAEYHMMVDYAGEMALIDAIKNGTDVHTATQHMLGLDSRDPAKTINFGLLYGMGVKTLALKLRKREWEAKSLKTKYFERLRKVTEFIFAVKDAAKDTGYLMNWFGRYLQYDAQTSYKAPNGLIQSGVGDQTKVAMVSISTMEEYRIAAIRMLLQVHDSLLFEVKYGFENVLPKVQQQMEAPYPFKHLKQTTSAQYSALNWGELSDTIPLKNASAT